MESNHPVHILNTNGKFSRSSFIPFCAFGDKLIGSEIDGFDMKVCNIFKPKLNYDQLCFETDLQELKDRDNLMNQLELGLTLVLDYNEERQIMPLGSNNGSILKNEFSFNLKNGNSLSMHLDTISIHTSSDQYLNYQAQFQVQAPLPSCNLISVFNFKH